MQCRYHYHVLLVEFHFKQTRHFSGPMKTFSDKVAPFLTFLQNVPFLLLLWHYFYFEVNLLYVLLRENEN